MKKVEQSFEVEVNKPVYDTDSCYLNVLIYVKWSTLQLLQVKSTVYYVHVNIFS